MYPSDDARELNVLMRISRALDIVGDVSASVDNPSELLAWAHILPSPIVLAWRALDSEQRYLQVSATHHRSPIHGKVNAVLSCDHHRAFWTVLLDGADLKPGTEQPLSVEALARAWAAMPLTPPAD